MAFTLYPNKSSVRKRYSRYVQGGLSEVGERFIRWWERRELPVGAVSDIEYTIPELYAAQPDLIGYDYYGRNDLGWLVLQYNSIVDVNVELAVGKVIKLPARDRVFYEILSQPTPSKG